MTKLQTKISWLLYFFYGPRCSFHFYCWNQLKVTLLACALRTRNIPKFSATSNAADNVDNSQSQAASDDRLLSHMTIAASNAGSKQQAHRAGRFEPNTVFWVFHTIQPSSFIWNFKKIIHALCKSIGILQNN